MLKPNPFKSNSLFSLLPSPDPGFGGDYEGHPKRLINKDGSFNAHRVGVSALMNVYQSLINMSWGKFMGLLVAVYFILNAVFAFTFLFLGEGTLNIDYTRPWSHQLLNTYFFSVQTFTTVGYGGILPVSGLAGFIASIEALFGLLFTAVATGLLYGRFSRPKAKIVFSENALVSPYRKGKALMFRIANARNSQFTEMNIRVIYTREVETDGQIKKQYYDLALERKSIVFFPLSWTVVHPITEDSPMHNLPKKELEKQFGEILILVTGYDDTFNQTVHCRHSYTCDEVVWDAKFKKNFSTNAVGDIQVYLDQVGAYEKL